MSLRVFRLMCLCVWVVMHSVLLFGVLACVYDCGVGLLFLCLRDVCELLCEVVCSVAVVWVLFAFVCVSMYVCFVCA